jgi:hypothetical protein
MSKYFYFLLVFFLSFFYSQKSHAWCGDSVRIVVERNCEECIPDYETVYHYDSLGRIKSTVLCTWNGLTWQNLHRFLYSYWNDTLPYENEYDSWQNGAWTFGNLHRFTYNNHGFTVTQLDSFPSTGQIEFIQITRDIFDNPIDQFSQHWNGNQWINDYRSLRWYDSQSRDTMDMEQTGDSLSWINQNRYINHFDSFGNNIYDDFEFWDGSQWIINHENESWFIGTAIDTLIISKNGVNTNWQNYNLQSSSYDAFLNRIYVLYQHGNDSVWINKEQDFYSFHDTLIDSELTQIWDTTSGWVNKSRMIFYRDSIDRIIQVLSQVWNDTVWSNEILHINYYLPNGRIDYETDSYWNNSWTVECTYLPNYNSQGVLVELRNSCEFYGCTTNFDSYVYDADHILIHSFNSFTSCGGGVDDTYYDYYYNLASGDSVICDSNAATISVANCPGYFYLWNTGDTTASITVSDSGVYSVDIVDPANHHIYTQPFQIYSIGNPIATHATDSVINICGNSWATIKEPLRPYASYQWIYNDTLEIPTSISHPNELDLKMGVQLPGSYRVIVKTLCGIDTSSATIANFDSIVPVNHITSSGDTNLCAGSSIILSSDSIYNNYLWFSTNATTQNITVTTTGDYQLMAFNDPFCRSYSNTIHVAVSQNINALITASGNTTICSGEVVSLTSSPFPVIHWNTGDSSMMIHVTNAGNYFTVVENASGCIDTSNIISVVSNPLPVVTLGNDTVVCNTSTLTLDPGSSYINYLWHDGSISQTYSAFTIAMGIDTMNFSVMVTDNNGCRNSDSIRVIFDVCSGVIENSENGFTIYPNPANNNFKLSDLPKEEKFLLRIINIFGEDIYMQFLSGRNDYFIEANLSPGIYFVQISNKEKSFMDKLVIEQSK